MIKNLKIISTSSIYVINLMRCILIFIPLYSCKPKNKLKDPLQAGWNGKDVCTVLQENKKIRVLKCVFPPNVGHEKHFHAEHFGHTLKGGKFRITDKDGTREVNVPTNYEFYNKKIEWHQVLNIGDTTAEFLIIEPK